MTAQPRLLGGRYQVGELLGYGGMAEVHRGRDLRLGRDVAIKMLRVDLARDATFQLRFRREAQNAASLNHPAIVAVYDTGEERAPTGEALPYIVMEFVNGRTLKEVLAAEGRLMSRRALEITADICSALEFSHRHGIIHRDIKPGNVMLTQNGQVKVMDFGIARALASGATTMTQTSAVIGTAQYLSPEQARGEAVDARSDVYATGCVLYELLTGHPPFVGDNPVSVAYQHVREDPRPPSNSNRDVPPDIDAVVLKALAKNPINRYQSAAEMRGDLLRAAAGRPVYATPVMPAEEVPPAAPTARLSPAGRNGPRTGQIARVPDPRRRRASGWVIAALSALAVLAVVALTAGLILANQPKKISVPGVVGLTKDQAEVALRQKQLVTNQLLTFDATCTKDVVLTQDPREGTKVEPNTKVTYNVCAGPRAVTMPDVVGQNKTTADTNLKNAGLKPTFEEIDSERPKDEVVSTNPVKGAKVNEGQQVVVRISKGNLKAVLDVLGKSPDEAKNLLTTAGFRNVSIVEIDTTNPDRIGKVYDQDPDGGTIRDPNTVKINLFVGKAVESSPPPTPTTTGP
jgi:beta-lactam-binding protein with PASTA domain